MMSLEATVRKMRDVGAIGVAVVSRDGTVLTSDLPPGVVRETFSIMCATIHGAGMTVANQLGRANPKRITMDSSDGVVVISEGGRRSLIVCVLPPGKEWEDVADSMTPLIEQVVRETG